MPDVPFHEYIQLLRNQIILALEQSKEATIKNFDEVARNFEDTLKKLTEQEKVNS